MLALVALALVFLVIGALCLVAAPWLVFGRAALAGWTRRYEVRLAASAAGTLAIAAIVAPLGALALISNGETVQHLTTGISGLTFGA